MGVSLGPDFLCIGMAKAGTGWLGDQLRFHPQFWIPIQELGYLDGEFPPLLVAKRRLARLHKASGRRRKDGGPPRIDPRDIALLEEFCAHAGEARDLDRYASAYRLKGGDKAGDISPSYLMLDGEVISELSRKLPELRVVLLLRDPLDRLWSHISMWHRNEKFDSTLLDEPERFRNYLNRNKMTSERSFPTDVVKHWAAYMPAERFRFFFFDDIAKRPDYARTEILTFLGGDPALESGDLPASFNRKAESPKLELRPSIKAVLLEHCRDELLACARELGGPAKEWPRRYSL